MADLIVEQSFNVICKKIREDTHCQRFCHPGMCRYWTRSVLSVLDKIKRELQVTIEYEAREVHIEPQLSHTFVRIIIKSDKQHCAYLIDGVGVLKYGTYFGKEIDCPNHLRHSHSDQINLYRS